MEPDLVDLKFKIRDMSVLGKNNLTIYSGFSELWSVGRNINYGFWMFGRIFSDSVIRLAVFYEKIAVPFFGF